jgi:hypothetical protein
MGAPPRMVQSLGLASGLECDLAHSLNLPRILKKLTKG